MGCFGRKPKKFQCTIVFLDETDIVEEVEYDVKGDVLLEKAFGHLNLLETAYFGLRFLTKAGESRWLDPNLKITKQKKGTHAFTLYFGVKFYASDPCKLLEEITRYQFVLQLKQDILLGRLPVNNELAAQLFALSLQAELGDYDPRKHHKLYVSEFRFLPDQNSELEDRVEQIHKTLIGQVPSSVEMTFLEKVKWLDMYGVDLHSVMGDDHIEYFLCLTPSGVVVMKNRKRISNYFWPRISKVFFKGKYFMIRVRDKANDEMTYGFLLSSKDACEYLWKCCVEHHAFFRLTQVKDISGNPMQIFRLGSKYRYSGRTEQQLRNEMQQRERRPPPPIVRVPSRRVQKRMGPPDGADADAEEKEAFKKSIQGNTKDDLAVLQIHCSASLYRSSSTPAVLLAVDQQIAVPQEAPVWEDLNQSKAMFSSRQSLASLRSNERRSGQHRRSSSIDSHASGESRRRRHHRRRNSDNDSDISKSSRGSRSTRNSSHRKSRSRDSGSESDNHHRSRRRKHSSRRSSGNYLLVDSESQWKMVQKQQQEKENQASLQSAVVRDLSSRKKSGYVNSGIDTESEAPVKHRKKHRRHSRSRSRSPEASSVLSTEVKKHLQYKLIDSTNLTEEERKDIKYTKVESDNNVYKIRYSPTTGRPHRYKVTRMSSRSSLDAVSRRSGYEDDPPPPYTPSIVDGDQLSAELSKSNHTTKNASDNCHSNLLRLEKQSSSSQRSTSNSRSKYPSNEFNKDSSKQSRGKHHRRKKPELLDSKSTTRREISTEL